MLIYVIYIFLPFVAVIFGTWGQIAKDIINYISKRCADKHMENKDKSMKWIYKKISVEMHRGNANMIISRRPIVDFIVSLFYCFY